MLFIVLSNSNSNSFVHCNMNEKITKLILQYEQIIWTLHYTLKISQDIQVSLFTLFTLLFTLFTRNIVNFIHVFLAIFGYSHRYLYALVTKAYKTRTFY